MVECEEQDLFPIKIATSEYRYCSCGRRPRPPPAARRPPPALILLTFAAAGSSGARPSVGALYKLNCTQLSPLASRL
ncbi:hypothetical protein EVAR_16517_1 [Eumeta japonica]|uniref:Uncharacterized protein n=1 Tax=Eumeta variegata TaxID=151549 RepID=A0A4C1U2R0_EUMVA|nr:hypothetical protein EVAR_16517_1 [Eumeta japonica]